MATSKPRITITLEPDDHQSLQRLARAQGVPMARVLREFIHEVGPVLARLADTLEAAKKAEATAAVRFRRAAEDAEEELRPLADMIRNQFDLFADDLEKMAQEDDPEARKRA